MNDKEIKKILDNKTYLFSRIPIIAKAKKPILSIKSILAIYPGLALISEGTSIKYVIKEDKKEHFYVIELNKFYLVMEIYSNSSPLYLFGEALLRLLSIAEILSDFYEYDISSIFPYIILAISQKNIYYYDSALKEIRENNSDIILAKRITHLLKENYTCNKSNSELREKNRFLIKNLLVLEAAKSPVDLGDFLKRYGIPKEDLEKEIKSIDALGFKAVYSSSKIVNFVKL